MGSAHIPRFDRLSRLLGCLLLAAVFAIGGSSQTSAVADADTLLANSATAMNDLQSFHFAMSISTGEFLIFDGWELAHAEGDVEQPHILPPSLSGTVKVLPVTANVVVIGSDVWAAISPREDRFTRIDLSRVVMMNLAKTFDPAAGLARALNQVHDPAIAGIEEVDGVATTVIEGTIDLNPIDLGTSIVDLAAKQLSVRIWIDSANLVRRVEVVDHLLTTDHEKLILQLDLSNFNEPVHITAP